MRNLHILPVLFSLLLGGCGAGSVYHDTVAAFSSDRVAVAPYDENALWNLKQGREYAAQGRYELAKEHYLIALASSNDAATHTVISHELRSVDMAIQTQR